MLNGKPLGFNSSDGEGSIGRIYLGFPNQDRKPLLPIFQQLNYVFHHYFDPSDLPTDLEPLMKFFVSGTYQISYNLLRCPPFTIMSYKIPKILIHDHAWDGVIQFTRSKKRRKTQFN